MHTGDQEECVGAVELRELCVLPGVNLHVLRVLDLCWVAARPDLGVGGDAMTKGVGWLSVKAR